ncbi:pyridoxal phosphate-dependent decarboxylase family protein [Caldimonas sp. KR1-144]|uniref:pyridoxal phosphate-dependent decarboxylase family protein n=1 Tax=Caldimonas sp. KR1-144 TaxID=3400911 RepID=UPI003C007E97
MTRDAALAMPADEFRALGHALVERIAITLEGLRDRPVMPDATPAEVRALVGAANPLPRVGQDAAALLDEAMALLLERSPITGHPRFHGYIASSPAPIGMLAELLAAALNANVSLWRTAPVASEIEAQTLRWLAELVGLPEGAGGLLTSGGNSANTVALLAARHAAGDGARAIYASRETHGWLAKAVRIAGLGDDAVRWIETDERQRLHLDALRARLDGDRAQGIAPLTVIATAGTVSTGAVDPLRAMAALCRERGLWLHVDGAYGAPAACLLADATLRAWLGDAADDLAALGEADSLALDPHKWLYAPLEAGGLLLREPQRLRALFAQRPSYYAAPSQDDAEGIDFHELGPQNSRGFRALKVWLILRMAGRDGIAQMIADDIALAQRLHAAVCATPQLEAGPRGLSITTMRYRPADWRGSEDELDALNRALLDALQRDGRAFLSPAVVDGRFWLRACVANFRTEMRDVDALPALIMAIGDDLMSHLPQ